MCVYQLFVEYVPLELPVMASGKARETTPRTTARGRARASTPVPIGMANRACLARLRKEVKSFDPPPYIRAAPLETNLQVWPRPH